MLDESFKDGRVYPPVLVLQLHEMATSLLMVIRLFKICQPTSVGVVVDVISKMET